MDMSSDEEEDPGVEEYVPQMGTIASLEEILRTLVATIQEEFPQLRETMAELVSKLPGGFNQTNK